MDTQPIQMSTHACTRQAQRNLSAADIAFVLEHGRHIHSGGAIHVVLGRRDMPRDPKLFREFERLEGTILVIAADGETPVLITAYRNRGGFKAVRSKTKYRHTRKT